MVSTEKTILFISDLPIENIGKNSGIKVISKTIEGFYNAGWKTSVICPTMKENTYSFIDEIYPIKYDTYLWFAQKKVVGFMMRSLFWAYFIVKVKQFYTCYLRDRTIDVIYCIGPLGIYSAKKIHTKCDSLLVQRQCGVASVFDRMKNRLLNIKNIYSIRGYQTPSDLIIVTDDGTNGKFVFEKLGIEMENFFFWRNGVDKKLFTRSFDRLEITEHLKIPKEKYIILAVSRLSKLKRIDRVIEVFHNLLQIRQDVFLIIVGDGEKKSELKEMVEKRGLKTFVRFEGAVEFENLPRYYHNSDLFLSLYDTSNAGNPLFEAMLSGCCIITLDTGETKKFLPHISKNIFKTDEVDKIHLRINELLNDEKEREAIGDIIRKYSIANLDTWDSRIEKEIALVDKYLRKKNRKDD